MVQTYHRIMKTSFNGGDATCASCGHFDEINKLIWDKERAKVSQVPGTWYLVSGQLWQLASVPGVPGSTIVIGMA